MGREERERERKREQFYLFLAQFIFAYSFFKKISFWEQQNIDLKKQISRNRAGIKKRERI
jgi:hypothetical protein